MLMCVTSYTSNILGKNRTYVRDFGSSFKLGERDADNFNSDTHIESQYIVKC